ncbi:hypothetical protein GQ600_22552 [Phytophthora cactorum]|nr:hypothetical protein GQ600_22552 [Phytophthora cactorum]
MKCVFSDCINPELTSMDPCSVCERGGHHLCSNDLYDPGNIANITVDVHHYQPIGKRDNVWDVAHVLATPYATGNDNDAEGFTHVCVLCALRLTNPEHDHLVAKHESHPMRKAEAAKRVKRAPRSSEMMTKKRAQQRLWGPTTSELSAHIARWLIHDGNWFARFYVGLPYNTVVIEDFRLLVEQLTGSPEATILSCHTFNDMLRAWFVRFCEVVMRSLKQEFRLAYILPFLNLLHDLWTNGTGKKGAIGASISAIDSTWRFCHIALLVTVFNGSHESDVAKTMILARILKLHGVEIKLMTLFLMSDTRASACKVSKLFEDAVAVDNTMHVLNLRLVYGLGMRKERGLNNYFKTPQRGERPTKVQQLYGLPDLKSMKYDEPDVFKKISLMDWYLMTELEAVTESPADRRDQIASELILFLRFAGDRINFNSFLVYDLEALRSPKPNAKSHSRHRVDTNARSAGAQACVALVKVQVNKRISTTIAETVLILVLDRRTKCSVDSLVRLGACATTAAQEMAGSTSDASEDISNAKFDEFIEERH